MRLIKRLLRMAGITAAVWGAVLTGFMVRGAYFIHAQADNWRLLPFLVPAERYEQQTYYITYPFGNTEKDIYITCSDMQGYARRTIFLRHGDWIPSYTDYIYAGDTHTEYWKGMDGFHALRITEDGAGRTSRVENNGLTTVQHYDTSGSQPNEICVYDEQGLLERTVNELDRQGLVRHSEVWSRREGMIQISDYTWDDRGNMLTAETDFGDGDRKSYRWDWEYDDEGNRTVCRRPDGTVEYRRYDMQGREISYESVHSGSAGTALRTQTEYRNITRHAGRG